MSAPGLEVVSSTGGGRALGTVLLENLRRPEWSDFRACVAFLKYSGFRYIAGPLDDFLRRGGTNAVVSVGIDHHGTSLEGLQDLWRVMDGRGDLFVFKEGQGGFARTFHPKGYVFERDERALALVGSGNLTAGGLFNNHELSAAIDLDLADGDSAQFASDLRRAFAKWQRPGPACRRVDEALLRMLVATGELVSEAEIAAGNRAANARTSGGGSAGRPVLFAASGDVPFAPPPDPLPAMPPAVVEPPPAPARGGGGSGGGAPSPGSSGTRAQVPAGAHQTFVIQVRPHHNGEVFLSTVAFREDPGFFGAPFGGWTEPKRQGNPRYPMAVPDPFVRIVVHDQAGVPTIDVDHSLNLVHYLRKGEIRITIPPAPLAAIADGWLLAMTRQPTSAYDYALEFFPPNCTDPRAQSLHGQLTVKMPSGGAATSRYYGWA